MRFQVPAMSVRALRPTSFCNRSGDDDRPLSPTVSEECPGERARGGPAAGGSAPNRTGATAPRDGNGLSACALRYRLHPPLRPPFLRLNTASGCHVLRVSVRASLRSPEPAKTAPALDSSAPTDPGLARPCRDSRPGLPLFGSFGAVAPAGARSRCEWWVASARWTFCERPPPLGNQSPPGSADACQALQCLESAPRLCVVVSSWPSCVCESMAQEGRRPPNAAKQEFLCRISTSTNPTRRSRSSCQVTGRGESSFSM